MARRRTAAPTRTSRRAGTAPVLYLALAPALALTGCTPSAHGAHPGPALTAATAPADSAAQRIGVLRLPAQNNQRSCTASVVDSPDRDLLVTAAHCVYTAGVGPVDGLTFAPGYRDGATPLGEWAVDKVTVDQHWQDSGDPEYDVAFLSVRPSDGRRIEDAVGGNRIGVNRGFNLPVTVTGYPYDHETPVTCTTRTSAQSSTQQRFDCGGFPDGTSGSPWLTDQGELVGVIGGYQQGGDTPDVSYSVSFDDRVLALYRRATG
ncbi:serine protease [Streptomyces tateyamensis]|uniref:Serine protease n=1 Tax=Streptomyces tateyamensis TaxID=565073 RepID=A0A2V4NAN0_9ACTN|nr:trypsin-like peptidase domain-containing protein [Streptomyces tateyamensis]PYC73886.1 serine protease [Streptomyces tateyamensis]